MRPGHLARGHLAQVLQLLDELHGPIARVREDRCVDVVDGGARGDVTDGGLLDEWADGGGEEVGHCVDLPVRHGVFERPGLLVVGDGVVLRGFAVEGEVGEHV